MLISTDKAVEPISVMGASTVSYTHLSSIVFLGAIIAKCGEARMSFPGGCELGPRPIDIHLASLERMGVNIKEDHGDLDCTIDGKMVGTVSSPWPGAAPLSRCPGRP